MIAGRPSGRAGLNGTRGPGPVGLITGSGTYALEGLEYPEPLFVETEFGAAEVTAGFLSGIQVLHVSRHGDGHPRLSNHVNHRANIAALTLAGARCAVAMTICGAVDPTLLIGDLVVFDDLYFPSNRLPDGSICTLHVESGDPRRAHWVFERPYTESLREALQDAGGAAGMRVSPHGCYGHVDGPRFNTAAEIRALELVGVSAVSQTGGPETVLAGEAGLPYALVGYVTDYANGVGPEQTTMRELMDNMVASVDAFTAILHSALPRIAATPVKAPGVSHGFERDAHLYRSPTLQRR